MFAPIVTSLIIIGLIHRYSLYIILDHEMKYIIA
jgi:hypothetical protein